MNIPLLLEIADRIAKRPEQFQMAQWFSQLDCGTVCCVAGWACVLSDIPLRFHSKVADQGAEVLGLDLPNSLEHVWNGQPANAATRLFYLSCWPEPFNGEWESTRSPEQRAAIAVRRIHHFIQTGGHE